MLRIVALAGGLLMAATALAAGHIPARYVGAFPDFGRLKNITGVFAGSTLVLKGTFIASARMTSVTGNLACTRASSTQTRCRGRFESADGLYAQRVSLAVTWQNGKPVKITH